VTTGLEVGLEQGLALERELQQRLFEGQDAKEGLSALPTPAALRSSAGSDRTRPERVEPSRTRNELKNRTNAATDQLQYRDPRMPCLAVARGRILARLHTSNAL